MLVHIHVPIHTSAHTYTTHRESGSCRTCYRRESCSYCTWTYLGNTSSCPTTGNTRDCTKAADFSAKGKCALVIPEVSLITAVSMNLAFLALVSLPIICICCLTLRRCRRAGKSTHILIYLCVYVYIHTYIYAV